MNIASRDATNIAIPFDQARVDRAMDEAGLDVLLASSKHNVQYLLGGYKFIFFSAMEAIGHSRYLPVLIYEKGQPEHAGYVGNRMETGEHQVHPFWTPSVQTSCWGTVDAAMAAAAHLKKIGKDKASIGYEPAFLSADAYVALRNALPDAKFVDATHALERIRAIKTRGRDRQAAAGVGADHRFHACGVFQPGRGRLEAGDRRCSQARGDQSRPHLRILPAHPRLQPQPRRLAAALAEGRGAVDRFRRQLSRLYRRSLPHGGARRARCRTAGYPGRDRSWCSARRWRRPAPAHRAATWSPRARPR